LAEWDHYECFKNDLVLPWCSPGGDYLRARGIDPVIACDAFVHYHAEFGFIERPALVFFLQGVAGDYVGLWGLFIDGIPKDTWYRDFEVIGRHGWQVPDGGVFATANAFATGRVVIVQRPLDALSLAMCGLPAIATCGYEEALSWLPERCQGAKVIYLAYPATVEGNRLAARLCKLLKPTGARIHRLKPARDGEDWNTALVKHGRHVVREALRSVMVPAHRRQAAPVTGPGQVGIVPAEGS